jgi:hypothetical protein
MSDKAPPDETAEILDRIHRLLREHDELRTRLEDAQQHELRRDPADNDRRREDRRRSERRKKS